MTDKERYVNVAELKIKVRHWAKTRGMSNIALQNFTDMIKSLPVTVKGDLETTLEEKAEPVKHGQWIYEDTIGGMRHYHCTNCKKRGSECIASENMVRWWAFCPRCGAQMEPYGGEKND